MNIIKERRKSGAICPTCKSPDYSYIGRVREPDGNHQFKCNSCNTYWQFGKGESVYTKYK